ncbi:MAG: hypothetical protein L0Y58_06005 [Verrucomicrobia subdivision 3 bacterium]|nr:hypothetical protein [Limisphaerales bacterium]
MGFGAGSPDSSRTDGVAEAFNLPDALLVIPSSALLAGGSPGGPLAPECKTYLLTNHTDAPFPWRALTAENWITITPTTGSLAPQSGTTVTVCLNANAASLPFGSHAGSVHFINELTGASQGREVNVQITAFASAPFEENFESGALAPHWQPGGTGAWRIQVTDQNGPRGQRHLTLDNFGNGIESRNELTLGIDLAGFSNVVLRFFARHYGDEPEGPPPTPFIGGADFDGVAISSNGIEWYEVQGLRDLSPGYQELIVNLDDAIARFGLAYNPNFRIRFNEFDNFSIPLDGIALDDIRITGEPVSRLVVTLPPEMREGETGLHGTVLLGVPLARDIEVQLTSSAGGRLRVPASVVVAAGTTQAVFAVTAIDNNHADGSQTISVDASTPGFFAAPASMIVHDNDANRLRIKLSPNRAREGDGFFRKMGVVRADRKPSRDVRVKLTSGDLDEVRVPASIVLPAARHSAEFDVLVVDDSRLDGTRKTLITAQVENWETGAHTLEVEDNDSPFLVVSLPGTASEGNNVLTNAGRVRLLSTVSTNLMVSLTTGDPTELIVPPSVTIQAGKFSADFDVTVLDDAEIDGVQSVAVTAAAPSFPSASAAMEILDDETPPAPYRPSPPDRSSGQPLTTDLSWLGGVGEIVRNGDFETGDLIGWTVENNGLGDFVINDGKFDPQSLDGPSPPYEGKFSVVTDQTGGGTHALYQDVQIPLEAKGATLSWVDKIRNHSTQFDFNQNFRVEVRNVANQVLAVAFSTSPGFPLTNDWTRRSVDLTEFRGQTIRIAFVERDHLGYFNVHLDNISVRLDDTGVTTFDVYFGTNQYLTATNLLGNTASNLWSLPDLALSTSYYWQIVSRRGASMKAGPVWQFSTRGVGKANSFDFGPISPEQTVGVPFAATLFARDDIGNIAQDFQDTVEVSAFCGGSNSSAVVITEIDTGTNDRVEFLNVSGRRLNLSNWEISLYDNRSWPAPRATFKVPTNSIAVPGQLFLLTVSGTAPGRFPAFFAGTNLVWSLAGFSNYVAVLVRDASGNPVDFFCAGDAHPAAISAPISISQSEWSGLPVVVNTNASLTYQRTGNMDRSTAEDWLIATNGIGRRTAGLQTVFKPICPVRISPAAITNFVDGVWNGELTFEEPASNITVLVKDRTSHFGLAGPFSTAARNDLSLSVTDSPDLVVFGGELTYQFIVANTGPDEINGITLSNPLPTGVEFVSATASQGNCAFNSGTVECSFGTLAGATSATLNLIVRPTVTGLITNTAVAARSGPDGFDANNQATAVSTVFLPSIFSGPATVNEGHTNSTNMVFTFRLSAPSPLVIAADYRTTDLSATAGIDYLSRSGVLTFPPGVITQSLVIEVLGDRLDEAFEQFGIDLSSPVNARIGTPQVRGRINDDDATPTLSISDIVLTEPVPGSVTNAVLHVWISAPSGLTVSCNYTTTNGTALAGRDFFTDFGQIVFPPGTTNQSFSVRVMGDTLYESNEMFFVNLFAGANVFLPDPQGAITVQDNGFVDLDHFEWETIPSPQRAGVPFQAALTARDGRNSIFPDFNGSVRINAISARRDASIGSGTNRWEMPMGTLYHDARLQALYLAEEIGAPGKINALALNVVIPPGQTMSNWTIRLQPTDLTSFSRATWESAGWTVVYRHHETIQNTNWVTFVFDQPFDYDGVSNLLVDLSFDNSSYTTDGEVAGVVTDVPRSIHFQTDSAFGDPLAWTGMTPPPLLERRIPQARFTIENFLDVDPAQVGPFVNGVWTGPLTVLAPGTNVFLRATDQSGRNGGSAVFVVEPGAGQAVTGPLRIAVIAVSGNDLSITFMTTAGRSYRVEATDSLAHPDWKIVADDIQGTGSVLQITDPPGTGGQQRFYRVRVLP